MHLPNTAIHRAKPTSSPCSGGGHKAGTLACLLAWPSKYVQLIFVKLSGLVSVLPLISVDTCFHSFCSPAGCAGSLPKPNLSGYTHHSQLLCIQSKR